MKTVIGIGLIILGIASIFRYPNLGVSLPETIGALIGAGLFMFLPGILLIRSDNKPKTN
jgi:zinc transporter ZupT